MKDSSNEIIYIGLKIILKDLSNKIVCFASLETPVAGYTDLKLKFQHSMNNQKLLTDLKMNYADGQEISGMIKYTNNKGRTMSGSFELKTPLDIT